MALLQLLLDWLAERAHKLGAWSLSAGGAVWAVVSDSRTLTAITVTYTGAMLFFLMRDKWWRQRGKRRTP